MSDKPKKLYENIVDELMLRIQSGELQPGAKLPAERILSKEFGVSRAVVREAFRAMERMGCVESQVGGGTYVKRPELSDVVDPFAILFMEDDHFAEELLETRLMLETTIAQLAAARCTEQQLNEMQMTLQQMEADIEAGGTGEEFDVQFHAQLVNAAGNRALNLVISTCSEVLNRTVAVTQRVEGVPKQALQDHKNILQALIQRDGTKAEALMREHLTSAQRNLRKTRTEKEP